MPYAASGGAFTNVAGATTAVSGNVVQSATWDNIHTDMGTSFTQVMQQLISGISNRNALYMNGGMEVWQRGAGNAAAINVAASTLAYTSDRWYLQTGVNQAYTVSAATGLSNGSQLAAAVQKTPGQTGITAMVFAYPLDTDEILRLRGNKVSFSCIVKAGANWSPASGTLTATLFLGTGASPAKRNATPYVGESSAFAISTNLTAGGANTTITGNSSAIVPTNTTQAELQFSWTPVGTAGAVDTISIDDVQIESQLSATTWTPTNFDRLDFFTQLQSCQRHFTKTQKYSVSVGQSLGVPGAIQVISAVANIAVAGGWSYPVRLRAVPDVVTYNPQSANANWKNVSSGADIIPTVDPLGVTNSDNGVFISAVSVSAAGQIIAIHVTASAGI